MQCCTLIAFIPLTRSNKSIKADLTFSDTSWIRSRKFPSSVLRSGWLRWFSRRNLSPWNNNIISIIYIIYIQFDNLEQSNLNNYLLNNKIMHPYWLTLMHAIMIAHNMHVYNNVYQICQVVYIFIKKLRNRKCACYNIVWS